MEINGLPLHALVTHAAVVLGPLAALTGIGYAVVPGWRDRLRWPLVVLAVVAFVSIWTAYLSGEDLTEANQYGGELAALVETHESRAQGLRIVVTIFAAVSLLSAWWHGRGGTTRLLLAGLTGAAGVATLIWVVLTGDAGAQVAWYGVSG